MQQLDRPRQALAVGLAALAGYVDALGFLSADGFFVSFMSGNTTRLAVEAAQGWQRAATPALLIGGFVCGVAGGAALGIRAGRWRKPAVVGLVAVLLLAAAALKTAGHHAGVLALLVLAMGAINNTFQRDGEVAIGLTYMTGALVKFGQGLGAMIAGQRRSGWALFLVLWLGLAGGALAGALAFLHIGAVAIWLAGAAACVATLAAWALARREVRGN
jgi:uncharacterized membrane protein YoaK (UPF0700 family)